MMYQLNAQTMPLTRRSHAPRRLADEQQAHPGELGH
jgi:hypothetical protein